MASYRDHEEELRQVRLRTDQVTDASLDSTRNMVRLCQESEEAGARTVNMLNEQGEQLDKIEGQMDEINADMRKAEKTLSKMDRCCGLCVMPWRRRKKFKEDPKVWKGGDTPDGKRKGANNKKKTGGGGGGDAGPSGNGNGIEEGGTFITRITNDAREDEMEDNLQQVSSMLGNMRNMAIDMGAELEGQNNQIERINMKADSNQLRMEKTNQHAASFIK